MSELADRLKRNQDARAHSTSVSPPTLEEMDAEEDVSEAIAEIERLERLLEIWCENPEHTAEANIKLRRANEQMRDALAVIFERTGNHATGECAAACELSFRTARDALAAAEEASK